MIRGFEQHVIREQKELEGYWSFTTIDSWALPTAYDNHMYVPACWESDIAYRKYRGQAAYKKVLPKLEAGSYRLVFKGVSHTAAVYLDGVQIASHYNAFTSFEVVFKVDTEKLHELVVLVDNGFSESSALHTPNDYYTYGGIIKPVVLEKIHPDYIHRVHCTTAQTQKGWQAQVEVLVHGQITNLDGYQLEFSLDNQALEPKAVVISDLKGNEGIVFQANFEFEEVLPWSSKAPNLYTLTTNLVDQTTQQVVDDLTERIGFREVTVSGQKILLNGDPIFIKGVNRHEDYNLFGCAIPMPVMATDIAHILDLNCNCVRTSHYPNDERFLDLCDERGILIFEESHARGFDLAHMENENFMRQSLDCIDEMIHYHKNHPSIVIWGILNECASHTEAGRAMYAQQFERIKALDQSRPLSFATCQHFKDLSLDLVDIIGLNLYYGWYDERTDVAAMAKAFEAELEWIDRTGNGHKPILITEFGAGGLYGYHAPHEPKWSEERQVNVLKNTLELYLNHKRVTGTIIWQYSDVRVTEEVWAMKRPRTMNNKGLVDAYRRPKLVYKQVQADYAKH